jgi:hypothetical protein
MNGRDTRLTLALYGLARNETHPARLESFASQDPIRLQATTRLPWSACLRLCHYARCRYWYWRFAETKQIRQMRRERRRLADDERYFATLQAEERREAASAQLPP